jgi:hypothetical protein
MNVHVIHNSHYTERFGRYSRSTNIVSTRANEDQLMDDGWSLKVLSYPVKRLFWLF